MKLYSINRAQGLYVIRSGSGYSCYGFANLDRKARAVRDWWYSRPRNTGRFIPELPEPGTVEHFAACADILERGAEYNRTTGERCPAELCPQLIGLEGRRVSALYFGERVRFNVGKSTGWLPCHIRLHNRAAQGGEGLFADRLSDVHIVA